MVSAKTLVQLWRSKRRLWPMFETEPGDRPLVAQLSGNDPALLAEAASLLAPHVDGVDLNLGCPQYIAQRSRYGAFLMAEPLTVRAVVRAMADALAPLGCLVCVKIRILPNLADTIAFAQMLEEAGCQLLCVHGRTKEQRGRAVGDADWDAIAAVKRAVGIPVIANGNIVHFEDVERCMQATGCDAVMSAWTLLRDPGLFAGPGGGGFKSKAEEMAEARDWLAWTARYHGRGHSLKRSKLHLFKRLYCTLQNDPVAREHLSLANTQQAVDEFLNLLEQDALPLLPEKELKPHAKARLEAAEEDEEGWAELFA